MKKIIKTIYSAFLYFICGAAVISLLLFFSGIRPYVVMTPSMEPEFEVGSLCIVNHNEKYENIKKDDVIIFKLSDTAYVTHRAVEITDDGIITQGDNNKIVDEKKVTSQNYCGKVIFNIPKIGYVFDYVKSPYGIICLISVLILLISFDLILDKYLLK